MRVVGMGGSAGGLEAFEKFFRAMPADSGVAFVLVSHLDPTHKGLMPELLQRCTTMKVMQATDGAKVQPNRVYVIPPNRDLSLFRGTLQLLEPSSPRGLRLPIDFFFRALAEDQGDRAVCIVLSGMGMDGTLGLRAVKERSGTVMAEDPGSARYAAMPQSAIDTGLVDHVARPEDLPRKLLECLRLGSRSAAQESPAEKNAATGLSKVLALLRTRTGHDFSQYKKNTLYRRMQRRMGLHRLSSLEQYARYLQESPHEIDLLFKELLIGVTSFFREPEAYKSLKATLLSQLPALPALSARGGFYRAWVVGCSTGEEAYSLAMLLVEALEEAGLRDTLRLQIYATDIDREAIDRARQGLYPAGIAADVPKARLDRFFQKEHTGYRIRKEIRETLVFAEQDLIKDPPFTRLDLLACRNLLIYLTSELQKKLLPMFHYVLNSGGIMFLGSSESISGFTMLFTALDGRNRVYHRRDGPSANQQGLGFPWSSLAAPAREIARVEAGRKAPDLTVEEIAQRIILQKISPPVVLINTGGDILYFTQRTGKYLEPPVGKANLNIFAMAREGLRADLGVAVRKALAEGARVTMRGVRIDSASGTGSVNLTVEPITEPESMSGLLMVVFEESPEPKGEARKAGRKLGGPARQDLVNQELEKELRYSKEHLQTVVEEMETSQEELKSTNEELQSTNEEMQSTNEELSTSKEEMQSLNEELTTLNAELQAKNDELTRANADVSNLLNSTQVPTLFMDADLSVKRFTPQVLRIVNLIAGDVGRPLTDIASNMQHGDLVREVREVLRSGAPHETQVQMRDGSWYLMRIHPCQTTEDAVDGAVVTFTAITALKDLEETLRREGGEGFFRHVLDPWPGCVYVYDLAERKNVYVNQTASAVLGLPRETLVSAPGGFWSSLLHPDDAQALGDWDKGLVALREGAMLEREYRLRGAGGRWRWFVDRAFVLVSAADGTPKQAFGIMDETTRWRAG